MSDLMDGKTSGPRRAARVGGMGFLLAVVAAGCGETAEAGSEEGTVAFQRIINVEVQPLAASDFQERIRLTGTVEANRDVMVSAEESGVIREVLVEEGVAVTAGEPLFRIDDAILGAQVAEAQARASLARETWERRRRLFEEDGVGSELAYLEARYQAEQAEAALSTLSERRSRTVIRAPIDGILDRRSVEVGTMVSPGTPVGRMVQIDPIKVIGGVPERYAGDVRAGADATVIFDVLRGETLTGQVRYVGATVNPENRTFDAELLFPNPGRVIKPAMVANIEIARGTIEDAIVVPQEALVRIEEGFVAFVVATGPDGNEIAEVRNVVLGPAQRNQVVIEEGLQAGDRLIVLGQNQVAQGDRIEVVRTRDAMAAGGDR